MIQKQQLQRNGESGLRTKPILAFLGGHALLGIAMKHVALLATAHALLTLLAGLYFVATARQATKVVVAVSYLMGAEVLWRMTNAAVFYECGKYATSALLLLWLLRHRIPRLNRLAVIYLALLAPSILLTCMQVPNLNRLRQTISFNFSGPFSLAVFTLCLYGIKLKRGDFQHVLLAMLGPLAGVAAICTFSAATLGGGYEFGRQSNDDLTGGFGANQVSAMLGFGMLAAFLWIHLQKRGGIQRWTGIGLILWFFAQAALTFSRTGVYLGIGTIVIASAFLLRDRRQFLYGIGSLAVLFLVGYFLVFPLLDKFTGGMLSDRYSQKGFTNREGIAEGDLYVAWHHPFLGVGVGMVKSFRIRQLGIGGVAHTEFTRLLAEHGALGVLALGALLLMGFQALRESGSQYEKAWSVSLVAFSLLFMLVSGMRLVAPSAAMGLAMLRFRNPRGIAAGAAQRAHARLPLRGAGRIPTAGIRPIRPRFP